MSRAFTAFKNSLVPSALALSLCAAYPSATGTTIDPWYSDYYARDFGWSDFGSSTNSCSSSDSRPSTLYENFYHVDKRPLGPNGPGYIESFSLDNSLWGRDGPEPVQTYIPVWGNDPNPFFDPGPSWGDPGGGDYGNPGGDGSDLFGQYGSPFDNSYDFVGNPFNAAIGNKIEVARDYASLGPFPVVFLRTYNSLPAKAAGAVAYFGRS